MKDNELRTVSDADYRRLMSEAYPSPKKDIRTAVMTQIMSEAAQSDKKAKILTPAFRKHFVRYGSIAACFVLLVTLGFRVLPMMSKDAVMESAADFVSQETVLTADKAYAGEAVSETAAPGNGAGTIKTKLFSAAPAEPAEEPAEAVLYSASLTDSIAEEPTEEAEEAVEEAPAAPMLMAAAAPLTEETSVEEAPVEEAVVEAEAEECVVEEAPADNAVSPLPLFEAELKLALTGEIDAEAYTAWLTGRGYTSAEDWSITEFVQNFGIPRERFTELYNALTASFAQNNPDAEIISYNLDELYPS